MVLTVEGATVGDYGMLSVFTEAGHGEITVAGLCGWQAGVGYFDPETVLQTFVCTFSDDEVDLTGVTVKVAKSGSGVVAALAVVRGAAQPPANAGGTYSSSSNGNYQLSFASSVRPAGALLIGLVHAIGSTTHDANAPSVERAEASLDTPQGSVMVGGVVTRRVLDASVDDEITGTFNQSASFAMRGWVLY